MDFKKDQKKANSQAQKKYGIEQTFRFHSKNAFKIYTKSIIRVKQYWKLKNQVTG